MEQWSDSSNRKQFIKLKKKFHFTEFYLKFRISFKMHNQFNLSSITPSFIKFPRKHILWNRLIHSQLPRSTEPSEGLSSTTARALDSSGLGSGCVVTTSPVSFDTSTDSGSVDGGGSDSEGASVSIFLVSSSAMDNESFWSRVIFRQYRGGE